MKHMVLRTLWVLAGLLLVGVGIFFMFSPGATLVSLSLLIGLAMLVSGILDVVVYIRLHDIMAAAGWVLADGIITILMSILLLFNQWATAAVLPFMFGMWLLFAGCSKLVGAFDAKRLAIRGWGWILALGIVLMAFGLLSFFKPVVAAVAISVIVGVTLVVQGVIEVLKGLFAGWMWM
nr:DUF308 domain-containing protein [bacterium]